MTAPAPTVPPVIALDGVGVTYRKGAFWSGTTFEAVRCVTFAVSAGETVGLVGESGSGKTTLGRVCLGLQPPSRGSVSFEGGPFGRRRSLRGRLSVVLQHPEWALNPRLRCGLSVAEPLTILGTATAAERRARVAALLEQVGLSADLAERYPGELSGGQRQRMAIARALVTEPRFVVFDEAVSALDVSVQAQVLNLILDLQRQHGFAALFISHDMAATRYVAHRIAVMKAGDLVELSPAERFYGQPEHPYSRQLLGSLD